MAVAPRNGQQSEILAAARKIIGFECANELPRLKQLVADHGAAVSALEQVKQKLVRLERAIVNQESYIAGRFAAVDTTGDALELLGWRESARIGAETVGTLTAKAVALEQELRLFLKGRGGLGDCLAVEQQTGWDKRTRESFAWLEREFVQVRHGQPAEVRELVTV